MRAGRAPCVRSCRWQSRAAIAREVPLVLGLEWGSARKPHGPFDLPSRRLVYPFARHGDCDQEGVDRAIVSGES